jgi:hypothetical protein
MDGSLEHISEWSAKWRIVTGRDLRHHSGLYFDHDAYEQLHTYVHRNADERIYSYGLVSERSHGKAAG